MKENYDRWINKCCHYTILSDVQLIQKTSRLFLIHVFEYLTCHWDFTGFTAAYQHWGSRWDCGGSACK